MTKSSVSSAACHRIGLTVLPVCGPDIAFRFLLGEPEHRPDRRLGIDLARLARRGSVGRRSQPGLASRAGSSRELVGACRRAANERLAARATTGGNGQRTSTNPWRNGVLAAARHGQSCARNGAAMEGAYRLAPISPPSASRIEAAARAAGRPPESVTLVAVSKTHPAASRARRARRRPSRLRREPGAGGAGQISRSCASEFPDLALHLIGPLQTNKVRDAVAHCDVIETVDRPRLAEALAREMERSGRRLPCLIEVNTGEEPQKAGVLPAAADEFIVECRDRLGLPIDGLMCVPPDRRGAGAAFRAAARDRPAQRARRAQHGDERRFREGDPLRRHPCPRRHRDLRRPPRRRGERRMAAG